MALLRKLFFPSVFSFLSLLLVYHPVLAVRGPSLIVNGRRIPMTAPAVIENGRTLLPLRDVSEALEADVFWDQEQKAAVVARRFNIVSLSPGSKIAYVNGKKNTLDAPAKVINGRLYVPVRFIAESLGVGAGWDVVEEAVVINDPTPAANHDPNALILYMNAMSHWAKTSNYRARLVWAEQYPGIGGGQFTGNLNFYSSGSGRNAVERASLEGTFSSMGKNGEQKRVPVMGVWTEGSVEYFKAGTDKPWQVRSAVQPLYDRGALALYAGTILARNDQIVRAWRDRLGNGYQVLHVIFAPEFRIFGLRTGLDLLNKPSQIGFTRDSLIIDRNGNIQAFERRRRVLNRSSVGEQVELVVDFRIGAGHYVEPPPVIRSKGYN